MKTTSPKRRCSAKMARFRMEMVALMCAMTMTGAAASEVCAPVCQLATPSNFTSDPSNCTQYYACEYMDDQVVAVGPISCPFFEYFDSTTEECLPIEVAPLGYCTSPCNPCVSVCDTPGQVLPDPLNCTKFYVCLNTGDLLGLDCDPGQQFDFFYLQCMDSAENINCFTFCEECEVYCGGTGQVERDPLDCGAYYLCEPPYKVHKACPEGQLFDQEAGGCSDSAACDDSCFVY